MGRRGANFYVAGEMTHDSCDISAILLYRFNCLFLKWNHFTILKPKSEQLNKPITAVLAAASMIGIMPLEFITKVDSDPDKRFRICR